MKGGGSIRGVVGKITWSYYEAARLENYRVRRSPSGQWSLTARIVLADAFKLKQTPLRFVAPTQKGDWIWPIVQLDIQAGSLTAQLGPPME